MVSPNINSNSYLGIRGSSSDVVNSPRAIQSFNGKTISKSTSGVASKAVSSNIKSSYGYSANRSVGFSSRGGFGGRGGGSGG